MKIFSLLLALPLALSLSLAAQSVEPAPDDTAHIRLDAARAAVRSGKFDYAVEKFTLVVESPAASPAQQAEALVRRGVCLAYWKKKREAGEADFRAALALPGAPSLWLAEAHMKLGRSHARRKHYGPAADEYRAALAIPGVPPRIVKAARKSLDIIERRMSAPAAPPRNP